jgi:exopolysaccharide biosynthesis polyprenyl glycosylphosphotransferase
MLAARIASRPELGIRIRGYVDLSNRLIPASANFIKFRKGLLAAGFRRTGRIIRGLESFDKALKEYAIDEVMFTDIAQDMALVEEGIEICSQQGVETTVAADLFGTGLMQSRVSNFEGMPLIHFQTPPGDSWKLGVKRMLDVSAAGLSLIVLSPFFLFVAVMIKLDSKGPVFFTQRRVGRHGRYFWMYKFRSMVCNAEDKLEELKSENEMKGPVFKIKKDPRVTKIGRFLRKHSIDEFPQLFNVFRGDMSLVGPRPPVPGEVSMYNRRDRRRLSMRPGMTCIWQVSGRNKIRDFDEWVQMDLEYIDNWSLSRDFVLMAQTIPAVISGEGAH